LGVKRLVPVFAILLHLAMACASVAQAPGGASRLPVAELDDLLQRLGSGDPAIRAYAAQDLDDWILEAGEEAKGRVEDRAAAHNPKLSQGIEKALTRIEEVGRPLALQKAAVKGDELRAWTLLEGMASQDQMLARKSSWEMECWICTDVEKVQRLVEGYGTHPRVKIAMAARATLAKAGGLMPRLSMLKSFDLLGIPSVAGSRRVALEGDAGLPRMPGCVPEASPGGWMINEKSITPRVLFDDGCVRVGRGTLDTQSFIYAAKLYLASDSAQPQDRLAENFWRAALFGRWALELRRFEDAVLCFEAATRYAKQAWPTEGEDAHAEHILRMGADFLMRQSEEPYSDEAVDRDLWRRLAALPYPECRARAAGELEAIQRGDALAEKWDRFDLPDIEKLSVPERVPFWVQRMTRESWPGEGDSRPGDILGFLGSATYFSAPAAGSLAALGDESIPALIEELDNNTVLRSAAARRRIRVRDVCLLLLKYRQCLPIEIRTDVNGLWPATDFDFASAKRDLGNISARLAGLGPVERRLELMRLGNLEARDWLLENDPATCAAEVFKGLPEDSRRRALTLRRIETALAKAPAEKLKALRDSPESELREAAARALAAKPAK
jgi:hypothetical protein